MRILFSAMTLMLTACVAALMMAAGPAYAADTGTPSTTSSSGGSSGGWSSGASAAAEAMSTPRALIGQGRYAEAASILRGITASDPSNADAHNLLGYASRKAGDYATAETAYAMALRLNPNHLGALEYQGELFLQTGRPLQARGNLARLETLCPGGCEARAQLAAAIARQP